MTRNQNSLNLSTIPCNCFFQDIRSARESKPNRFSEMNQSKVTEIIVPRCDLSSQATNEQK